MVFIYTDMLSCCVNTIMIGCNIMNFGAYSHLLYYFIMYRYILNYYCIFEFWINHDVLSVIRILYYGHFALKLSLV